ncbi:C69 family dipeptidase, partial [bacterium]|nr:C69 family dipeptidase [bacterium]
MCSKINKFYFVNAVAVLLFVLISLLFVSNLSACTTVVAGKKSTKNGAVLFGHNEDDSGRRVVNIWNVPRKQYKHGSVVHLRGGADIPQSDVTWALTWFQVPGLPFSDYYANEWGVNVASDACPSREDDPKITDGGIGFMLRRIVAERAKSAREGVEIAGKLLDKFGYVSSGRTLVICDPSEAWILAIVAGKHWVAQRVPDDKAIVLPNVY